jgi:hypothetical protein
MVGSFAAALDATLPLQARAALLVAFGVALIGYGASAARAATAPPPERALPLWVPTWSRPTSLHYDVWASVRDREQTRALLQDLAPTRRLRRAAARPGRPTCGPTEDGWACCSECALRAAAARRSRSRPA